MLEANVVDYPVIPHTDIQRLYFSWKLSPRLQVLVNTAKNHYVLIRVYCLILQLGLLITKVVRSNHILFWVNMSKGAKHLVQTQSVTMEIINKLRKPSNNIYFSFTMHALTHDKSGPSTG